MAKVTSIIIITVVVVVHSFKPTNQIKHTKLKQTMLMNGHILVEVCPTNIDIVRDVQFVLVYC